jgi:hypothetical protein
VSLTDDSTLLAANSYCKHVTHQDVPPRWCAHHLTIGTYETQSSVVYTLRFVSDLHLGLSMVDYIECENPSCGPSMSGLEESLEQRQMSINVAEWVEQY